MFSAIRGNLAAADTDAAAGDKRPTVTRRKTSDDNSSVGRSVRPRACSAMVARRLDTAEVAGSNPVRLAGDARRPAVPGGQPSASSSFRLKEMKRSWRGTLVIRATERRLETRFCAPTRAAELGRPGSGELCLRATGSAVLAELRSAERERGA